MPNIPPIPPPRPPTTAPGIPCPNKRGNAPLIRALEAIPLPPPPVVVPPVPVDLPPPPVLLLRFL